MLITGRLPDIYMDDAQNIERFTAQFMDSSGGGKQSTHLWVTDAPNDIRVAVERIRESSTIHDAILKSYGYENILINVPTSDEIYVSVSPALRKGSDIALSDCHFDAPFAYFPSCNNKFIRVIVACSDNDTVYTTVAGKKSMLTTLDFNAMDYNRDYHCVSGVVNDNTNRVLLKLHYLLRSPTSPDACAYYYIYINDAWTHISREIMRLSTAPTTPIEHVLSYIVLSNRYIFNKITLQNVILYMTIILIVIYIIIILL